MSTARNASCPCGSGLKYKHCCVGKTTLHKQPKLTGAVLAILFLGGLLLVGIGLTRSDGDSNFSAPPGPAPPGKVWSPEHGHWHDVR
jgi:hypothetical protein